MLSIFVKESKKFRFSLPYLSIILERVMETELEKALETLQNLLQVSKPDLNEEPFVPIDLCKELASLLLLFQEKFY